MIKTLSEQDLAVIEQARKYAEHDEYFVTRNLLRQLIGIIDDLRQPRVIRDFSPVFPEGFWNIPDRRKCLHDQIGSKGSTGLSCPCPKCSPHCGI